jgi:hypothetical protein
MAKPKPGDRIYIESTIYVHHGVDDFLGGICTVKATRTSIQSDGKEITEVEVEEDPNTWSRWEGYLEPRQEEWKKEYGEQRGRLRPDFRPEFNDDLDPEGWEPDPD